MEGQYSGKVRKYRLFADEARGEKSVQTAPVRIRIGELHRQRAQVALRGDELGAAVQLACGDRRARDIRVAREQFGDLLFAFLRLERADAPDEQAAGFRQLNRAVEQFVLQGDEGWEFGFVL